MVQFLIFFLGFFVLTSLRLKLWKVDEGLFLDKIAGYDHFMNYMFWYYKHKHAKWY